MRHVIFAQTFLVIACFLTSSLLARQSTWQQHVVYEMDIVMNVQKHQFSGKQILTYTNHSPDTLKKVYYHLYYNAFQPNSMMDMRSRTIADPDRRVGDRISKLKPNEIGYQKVNSLKLNGKIQKWEVVQTILKVELSEPILPGASVVFEMDFEAQVPLQIRRTGRMNVENIDYSMAQWYPKMAEYDQDGWHPDFYVGREFYGVWGDFDVKITIDKDYVVAATGYLQNPEEIGHGYQSGPASDHSGKTTLTWHFKAPKVHDFVWAADRDYMHYQLQVPDGPMLHFFYTPTANQEVWEKLPEYAVAFFLMMEKLIGKYPYEQYSVIQGGDGGMEYPMATLIRGDGKFEGMFGLFVHEAVHSWYYGLLGFHEGKYPWMDEGFTNYIEEEVVAAILKKDPAQTHQRAYQSYFFLHKSGKREPLTTHADHYLENRTYSISTYSMGAIFLHQLRYIVGEEIFWKGMQTFFKQYKYRHPDPWDFIRTFELLSDMELDWYLDYWIGSLKSIDYEIKSVSEKRGKVVIELTRKGDMPMPVDIYVKYKNGNIQAYTIPLAMMFNYKSSTDIMPLAAWPWTHPNYVLDLPADGKIEMIAIDPFNFLADIDRQNNVWNSSSK
jgi:hypothetical protein